MKKLTIAVALVILVFSQAALIDAKIIGNFSTDQPSKTITLDEAKVKENDSTSASQGQLISMPEAAVQSSNNSSSPKPEMKSEKVDNPDFIQNEVSAGNRQFVRSLIDGIYPDSQNTSKSVFSAITFVPNPYKDKGIVGLYGGYLNLGIYLTVLFIFGVLINRSLARIKLIRNVDLSQSAFIGGIAMCCFALVANIIFSGALDLIDALNKFVTLPAIPIVTNPDNLLLYAINGLCEFLFLVFFLIRDFLIYVVAVICGIIAILLVPEFTRDFAKDCIEIIIRMLFMQPAALFMYAVCIIGSESLPDILKPFTYIGMTILVFFTCWYFLFGNFTLLKKGVNFAITKGVVKI